MQLSAILLVTVSVKHFKPKLRELISRETRRFCPLISIGPGRRHSSVTILWAGRSRNRSLISGGAKNIFSLLHRFHFESGANPASYPMWNQGFFSWGKAAGSWRWPLISIKRRGTMELYLQSPMRLHGLVINYDQRHYTFKQYRPRYYGGEGVVMSEILPSWLHWWHIFLLSVLGL
jgi:hypothetical protein